MTSRPDILIDGAHILADGGFRPGSVLVQGGRIATVAWTDDDRRQLAARAADHVPADEFWLIPGLIDSHAHAYAAILRGTENSLPLELWALFTTLYGKGLDAAALRASILLGAAERIRGGVTGLIDHAPQMHLAEAALAAHDSSGLRVGYAPFLHDRSDYDLLAIELPPDIAALAGKPPPLDEAAYEARFADIVAAARGGSGRITPLLGPNAPQRCSEPAWRLWRRLRDRHAVGVHTHLLETRAQAQLGRRLWPGGFVAELARQDLLAPGLSVAHGIWLDGEERDILARHGVTVVHNPASNLMLGSGLLAFQDCRRRGIRLALGTDSANTGGRHDLFDAMRLAMMLHRRPELDPADWPRAETVVEMATRNGAAVLGHADRLGRIAPGCAADLVLIRRRTSPHLLLADTVEGFVLHAGRDGVAAVMIDGAWVLREGRILAFDEDAAIRDAAAAQDALRARVGRDPERIAAALPHIAAALRAYG